MALSQEILTILIVALSDRQAGEELFAAINGALSLSERTLDILVVAMANEVAALDLSVAIENATIISNQTLEILIVCLANRQAGIAIENQLIKNSTPTPAFANQTEFCAACTEGYSICLALWGSDTANLEICTSETWSEINALGDSSNPLGTANCANTSSGDDWGCGCDPISGCPVICKPDWSDTQCTDCHLQGECESACNVSCCTDPGGC